MLRHFLSILITACTCCACAQTDTLLTSNKILQIYVYQSDLDRYLSAKKITDTTGRTREFLQILSSAKFMQQSAYRFDNLNKDTLSFEDAVRKAEENYKLRHLVDKVLVIKHERKMYLQKKGQTIKTFTVALGPNPTGQKEYEGDGRTPEGIYTLDWQRWETPVFHSFHISYPNKADSIRAKTKGLKPGSNIMVHGTSKGIKTKKDWTNGCIALTNNDMIEFRKMVFQDTVIEIRK